MKKKTPSTWLIGTWRSDKKRTIEAWARHPPGSAEHRKLIVSEMLGKVTLTYGRKYVRGKFRTATHSSPYRVVWQSDVAAFVVNGDKAEGEAGQLVNFKTPDLYWVYRVSFVEYFSRVHKPNKAFKRRRAKRARP